MIGNYNEYSLVFKALSDPNRILILDYLKDGERCACVILEQLRVTQPTLSYHMKQLNECGIVNSRKAGKWMHYSLNKEKVNELKLLIDSFL